MIALATNDWLQRRMQRNTAASMAAQRFVAAEGAVEGARVALNLPSGDIQSSLFYLGEYVQQEDVIEQTVRHKIAAAKALHELGIDIHVSVDPTQIGASVDLHLFRRNAKRISSAIQQASGTADGRSCLMLDMEDDSFVEPTIFVHDNLLRSGYPVAITLQAYLRRTAGDLITKMTQGAFVRLVKGAFAARADVAYTSRREIENSYLELARMALSWPDRHPSFYPSFATHNERIQTEIAHHARISGRSRESFEFEMLFGVRDDLATQLAEAGHRVRLYMPFGTDWWPYAMRRIGENPRNILVLARALRSDRRAGGDPRHQRSRHE